MKPYPPPPPPPPPPPSPGCLVFLLVVGRVRVVLSRVRKKSVLAKKKLELRRLGNHLPPPPVPAHPHTYIVAMNVKMCSCVCFIFFSQFPPPWICVCHGTAVFVALAPLPLGCLPAASSLAALPPPSSSSSSSSFLKKVHQYFGWPLTWPRTIKQWDSGYTKWPGFATEGRLMRGCRL